LTGLFWLDSSKWLGLGCNLGKGLNKRGEDDKLVKYKDIGLHLQLYISNDYKKKNVFKENNKKNIRRIYRDFYHYMKC